MSGHSKWSTIKRQKAVTDAKRSAMFTKLARQINVAARLGGGDPNMNFRLRLAIDKAKAGNVPNDNIDRAIKAGTGEGREGTLREVIYEGFGPGGAAIIVEALTDNSNRTAAEVRAAFARHGGSMGAQNSVGWMFDRTGVIRAPFSVVAGPQRQSLELSLIDGGATDVREEADELVTLAPPERLSQLKNILQQAGLSAEADVEFIPNTTAPVSDDERDQLHALLEALDELEDVTHVTSNEA